MDGLKNEWDNVQTNKWKHEKNVWSINEWVIEWTNVWMNEPMNEWISEWLNEWMNEWADERMIE